MYESLRELQIAREKSLAQQAYEKSVQLFAQMADNGNGGASAPAAWVYGKYTPLAEAGIKAIADAPEPPRRLLSVLDDLGYRLCIVIAIEAALGALMKSKSVTRTSLFTAIGDRLNMELAIGSFTKANPLRAAQLHHRARKEVAGSRKKYRMFLTSAEHTGDPIIQIDRELGVQLGAVLCGALMGAGLIEEDARTTGGRAVTYIQLTQEATDFIMQHGADPKPFGIFSPMICEPDDWSKESHGGYLTPELKGQAGMVLGHQAFSRGVRGATGPRVYRALNALQKTPWRVCTRVLDVVRQLAAQQRVKEIWPDVQVSIPEYPEHLKGIEKADRTEEQEAEHKAWLDLARDAWGEKRRQESSSIRYIRVLGDAEDLKKFDRFYFVYAMDSRGRMYPRINGVSPQGSDLQKALIEFAEPSRIENDRQLTLFKTNLAHRWGFDKASYEDSCKWADENAGEICRHADEPLTYTDWMNADSPLLYLQAAMEYRDYLRDPGSFQSHIPIAMDGACNGSQHMAAILRDGATAAAVNLQGGDERQDLYGIVGKATHRLLKASKDLPEVLTPFLDFGVPRALVKRPTMTLPYGLTKRSVGPYLVSDFLAKESVPGLDPKDVWKAGMALTPYVWEALQDTVTSTMTCLSWLKKAVRFRFDCRPDGIIQWRTPDGFPAFQTGFELDEARIVTYCKGPISIRWQYQTDKPNKAKHTSGFAPNFIHSLDATHLRMTVNRMLDYGCDRFAMIHDDFGVPVGFSDKLWHAVREEFVNLYSRQCPLDNLAFRWGLEGDMAPPKKMGWDISSVRKAQYAFK